MWFGVSEANIHDIFNKACAAAPCIVFFNLDELDSIAKACGGSGASGNSGGVGNQVFNQILIEMYSMNAKNVFIIDATNRPDQLILHSFVLVILINLSTFLCLMSKSWLSILKTCLRKSPVAPEVNLAFLVKNSYGFSGADLAEICQQVDKLAIQASINADIWAAREKREHEEADVKMEDDSEEAEDPVPQITRL